MKKLLASILALSIVAMGSNLTAFAATDNNGDTDVMIEVQKTDLDAGYVEDGDGDGIPDAGEDEFAVTVPSVLPIVFNADETNTLPENWTVRNHSTIAGVSIVKVEMNANGSGWQLLPADDSYKTLAADTKAMEFHMGKAGELKLVEPTGGVAADTGAQTWDNGDIAIASGASQVISFDVNRGAFTEDTPSAKAFDMVLTFEFNK